MQRRDDPRRPSSPRGKFIKYSEDYYKHLLEKRRQRIDAALRSTRSLPRDVQERILDEAGLWDMPARGRYVQPIPPSQFYGY